MAKYIIEENNTTKYEKNYKFPLINIIPAVVWAIPIHQKLSPMIGKGGAYGVTIAFVILYMMLSFIHIVALAPAVGGVIILTALFWAPIDHLGSLAVRIILKGLILLIAIMIELGVFANATLPWLQEKTNKPRIRRVEE